MVFVPRFRLLAIMGFILSGSALAADAISIELPCGKTPYVSCADLQKRLLDGNTASKEVGWRTMVKELILGIYDGKVDAKGIENSDGTRIAAQTLGKPPICLALKVSENACKDEYQTNVRSEACPALSKVGLITRDKYFYGLGKGSRGTLETAHTAGGMALGISNQAIDIEKEIVANKLTFLSTSACYSRAQNFVTALKNQTDVRLLQDVALCEQTDSATCSSKKYFDAGMSTLQGAYLYLAKCRLIDEAAQKARKFSLNYVKRIEDEVVRVCFNQNRGYPDRMKACYVSKYADWIKMRARNEFTNLRTVCGN